RRSAPSPTASKPAEPAGPTPNSASSRDNASAPLLGAGGARSVAVAPLARPSPLGTIRGGASAVSGDRNHLDGWKDPVAWFRPCPGRRAAGYPEGADRAAGGPHQQDARRATAASSLSAEVVRDTLHDEVAFP